MKKIVIHCASGIRNTGDEAILDVLVRTFRGCGLESGSGGL